MKLLSIVVPCYNSQEYMKNCIESLLPGGEDVEIIIVNDGSVDKTKEIADEYASQYPSVVKAIHQENGGHGEAINAGLRNASGMYFKVVDSDDWVDYSSYEKILAMLKKLIDEHTPVDMFLSNFVYEKEGAKRKKVMQYESVIPQNQIITWEEIGHFRKGQYILMHSVIYKTSLLRECELQLPKHTFYVDNLFVYVPLPYVKTIYYLSEDFYRYYIGREDQSVNEQIMISRIDQQIKVNKLMLDLVDIRKVDNLKKRSYMRNFFEIVTVVSTILLIRSGELENLKKKRELWNYIKRKDIRLYLRIRNGIMGVTMNIPGRLGRRVSITAYRIAQKMVGFN